MTGLSSLLGMMLTGLIVGAIAKLIMPGKDPGGIVGTAIIGMIGALIGTLISRWWSHDPSAVATIPMAIVGSLILLGAYRLVFGGRRSD
ncbi:MAG: GlsB/YeaQ/YmgE family stress response membrane protein [Acidobacteria bacterium]|nr:GlsB/YeaQ/YmgE family stress response membrane protein [Acidobacteriota bacterium]MBI3423341.1 GlsB/YeaQ/YmgE family stress response membrane protein [Acidobacteriota bacterium]